jgi:DNA adenine methylase
VDFRTYPGGKNGSGVYQKIINLLPPHPVYVEPFLGSGTILRLKRPALASIGIDIDAGVLQHWNGDEVPNLKLIHADALEWLAGSAFPADSLVYLDPPYLQATRSSPDPLYRYEMTEDQHKRLLEIIRRLPCMVVISGYTSALYQDKLKDWRTVSFQAMTRGGRPAVETLWLNFPEPFQLHDYRYLGENYRERERIKRKQKRWSNRLAAMPPHERYALLAAVAEPLQANIEDGAAWRMPLSAIAEPFTAVSLEPAVTPGVPAASPHLAVSAGSSSSSTAAITGDHTVIPDGYRPGDQQLAAPFSMLQDPLKELDHGF